MKNLIERLLKARADRQENREGGFSLIELIVVVAILGILVAVAIPVYGTIQNRAADNAAKTACGSAVAEAAANSEAADDATAAAAAVTAAEQHHSKGDIAITGITQAADGTWSASYVGARNQSGTC